MSQTMPPEQRLQSQYSYEIALSQFQAKEADWLLATLDFFELCRHELPDVQLIQIAGPDCIVIPGHQVTADTNLIDVTAIPGKQ